jgi:hypothetical protein
MYAPLFECYYLNYNLETDAGKIIMERYLLEGEEILAHVGHLYASNKRLLRYRKHLTSEELDDIPYSNITSISLIRKTRRSLIKAGAVIAIVGIFTLLTLITIQPYLKSTSELFSTASGSPVIQGLPFIGLDLASLFAPLIPFSIIVLALGISMIGLGFFLPQVFIQFRMPGLSSDAEAKFRLGDVHNEASLNLVRTVRQQSLIIESGLIYARPLGNLGNQTPCQQGS